MDVALAARRAFYAYTAARYNRPFDLEAIAQTPIPADAPV